MPSEIAEHMLYGETHNVACEECGTHECVMYRCFMSGGGAHLCKDCMIRHEVGEFLPALFCCIGIPILAGVYWVLMILGFSTTSEPFIAIITAALAGVMFLLWGVSTLISKSYWKG